MASKENWIIMSIRIKIQEESFMDLKSFREDKLKIPQSAFAELIGVEQSSISRWEKDPDSIPFQVIQKILEKTGVSYEELTGWKKPIPKRLDVNNTWEKANFTKCTLSDYLEQKACGMSAS